MRQKGKRYYVKENTKQKTSKKELRKAEKIDDTIAVPQKADVTPVADESTKVISKRDKRKLIKKDKKLREKEPVASKSTAKKNPKAFDDNKKHKLIDFNDRRVLSYEDLPLDDSGRTRFQKIVQTVKLNKKSIIMSAMIIIILALCVLVFANRDRLSFANIKNWVQYGIFNMESEEHFPIDTEGAVISNGNFTRIDTNLVYTSDIQFVTLNSFGRTIYSYPQTFSNPVLVKAADCDTSLVYNLGGKDFFINDLDSTVFTGEAEDNILVADIAKNGTYALVTQKDGYLSKLFVYSGENKQKYAYSFADFYITSVSLDASGTTAVLSGISAHDGSQLGCVYVLDFTKEEPVLFQEFENNMLYYVDHLSNNYVCIIGENATYTLSMRTKAFDTVSYDSKTLTAFDVNTDTNTFVLSLSRNGDGRMCDILSFSSSGKLKKTIATNLEITSISTYKNRIATLSEDTVSLFSKDGVLLSETDGGLDPHCVVLYSTNDAYVLGVSEIRRLDLR
ncbi:MAG: hypothetical protein E7513_00235 [Ruminococcaceae bacterium]|nr:hypothetical protein [Oscillospiraceae bacterium]